MNTFFNRDGYIICNTQLSPAKCDKLAAEVERIHETCVVLQLEFPEMKRLGDWSVENPHQASSVISEWVMSKYCIDTCSALLGGNVKLYWAGTAHKPSLTGKIFPWHQDSGYGEGPLEFVTCWMALDQVDEENGCIWVIPGSHLGQVAPHELKKSDDSTYGGAFLTDQPSNLETAIPVRLRPGEMVFFSSKLIHESRSNLSSRKRRGIISSYAIDSWFSN
ncbi:MAG: phytanoyl-CoA dioxygenase family protein [Bdellovibrionaceae bacterium]|nr:phytanoyl-CoA dioxygenase family protein [Pseudobdellovibrionaceae bacterium]